MDMPLRLEDLIARGESANTEFKRSLSDSRRIVETIAAMAGVGGGVILVGVSDDGRVVGVDLGDGVIEQFTQRVLAATDPKVFTRIHVHFVVSGRQLDPKRVEKAIELSAEKYCSASIMLAKTATITHDFEIVEVG